jgi:uncharacterized membrane protein (DUF106 family)
MIPEWLATPPASTIFILFVSLLMAFASSLINRLFTSREQREQVKVLKRQIDVLMKQKNEDLKKAKNTDDKKLLKKVHKQEKQILQLQSRMFSLSFRQMKVFPITLILFLIVWLFLTGRVFSLKLFESPFAGGGPVAFLPWITGEIELSLFYWYLLCSFLFGTLFSRVFGLTGATE